MSTAAKQVFQKIKERKEEKIKKLSQKNMKDLQKMKKENIQKRKDLKKMKDYYRAKWEKYKIKIWSEEEKGQMIRSAIKYKKD